MKLFQRKKMSKSPSPNLLDNGSRQDDDYDGTPLMVMILETKRLNQILNSFNEYIKR